MYKGESGESGGVGKTIDDKQSVQTLNVERRIISVLNERQKLCLSLYLYDCLTVKEIASVMKISHQRVSEIISDCRNILRRFKIDIPSRRNYKAKSLWQDMIIISPFQLDNRHYHDYNDCNDSQGEYE